MHPTGCELQRLLAPLAVEEFLASHWDRKPVYMPGDPDRFRQLGVDTAVVEGILRAPPENDRLSIRYVGPDEKGRGDTKLRDALKDPKAYSLRAATVTVCVDWISDRLESLSSFCTGVRLALNLPGSVFMTCYASPAGHGFGTHFDCHPSFILQLEGAKRWRYSPHPVVEWPPANLTRAETLPEMWERYPWFPAIPFPGADERSGFLDERLTPGDVLFLPAGTWHEAEADEWSLALTMSCTPRTAVDLIDDFLRVRLSPNVEWRRSLPPTRAGTASGRLPPEVNDFLAARISELKRAMRGLTPESLYEAWVHHIHAIDTPFEVETVHSGALAVSTRFRRSPEFDLHYVRASGGSSVTIYHRDRRIDLAIRALPLIERSADGAEFTGIAATEWLAPGITWSEVRPLLQALVESGVFVVVEG